MARMTSAQFGYITGDVSSFAYRPLYGKDDIVYRSDEISQAVGANASFIHRAYKVVSVGYKTNAAGAPLNQAGTAISGAVASQATAPWVYDLQEVKPGETIATATGKISRDVLESLCLTLAQAKTLIGTEVGDWSDPATS